MTVAPGVQAAVRGFECKILRFLCLRPLVRFAYFPRFHYLFFRNFADKDERIARGMHAFELAQRAGWPRVAQALGDYGVMPPRLLDEPERALADLRDELARQGALASRLLGRRRARAATGQPQPSRKQVRPAQATRIRVHNSGDRIDPSTFPEYFVVRYAPLLLLIAAARPRPRAGRGSAPRTGRRSVGSPASPGTTADR